MSFDTPSTKTITMTKTFSIKPHAIQPFVVYSHLWGAIFGEVVAEGAAFDAGHGGWGLAAEVVVDFGGGV